MNSLSLSDMILSFLLLISPYTVSSVRPNLFRCQDTVAFQWDFLVPAWARASKKSSTNQRQTFILTGFGGVLNKHLYSKWRVWHVTTLCLCGVRSAAVRCFINWTYSNIYLAFKVSHPTERASWTDDRNESLKPNNSSSQCGEVTSVESSSYRRLPFSQC